MYINKCYNNKYKHNKYKQHYFNYSNHGKTVLVQP